MCSLMSISIAQVPGSVYERAEYIYSGLQYSDWRIIVITGKGIMTRPNDQVRLSLDK